MVTGQSTKFLINPFQRHSLCFSSGSSLSRCVLEGPAKTLRLSQRLGRTVSSSHTGSANTGAEGSGPPSSASSPALCGSHTTATRSHPPLQCWLKGKGFSLVLTGSTFKKRVSSVTAYSLSAAFLITSFLKLLLKGNL